MKRRFMIALVAVCAVAMSVACFGGTHAAAVAAAAEMKHLDRGSVWVVNKTTRLDGLTISRGAAIKAPEGHSLTLTVDSVGTAIRPGIYKGDIVLSVTKEIKTSRGNPAMTGFLSGGGSAATPAAHARKKSARGGHAGVSGKGVAPRRHSRPFRTAIYVDNGEYVPNESVAAAVVSGQVTDTAAKGVKITSHEGFFNGILVTGDSKSTYTITNPVINLTGNGGDDWTGLGSAIAVTGNAHVTIDHAKIRDAGYDRSAVFVGNHAVVHVNNSDIEVRNGILNSDVSDLGIGNVNMLIGPWLLGITGRVRATNVMQSGTVYYNNCHIKAQYWGCLSTDGPKRIRLYATKCLIETVESGYGAYSIGDCIDTFRGCTFNVVDYGLIICDFASGTFTDGCVVNSHKIGVMMHDGSGGSTLTINKGTVFNTRSDVIQIKGRRGANIFVDDAHLNSEKGIILQTMPNDDPNMSSWNYHGGAQGYSKDVNATFSNMELKGDIVNGFTASGAVNVIFKNATIRGAITTATVTHPLGPGGEKITMKTPELYYLIGEVNDTYCAKPRDPHGISASFDADSRWIIEETSFLTSLTIARGAEVTAPKGYTVVMLVDGVRTLIKAGTYKGQIVLQVNKNA